MCVGGEIRPAIVKSKRTKKVKRRPSILLWWLPKCGRWAVIGGTREREPSCHLYLVIDPKEPKSLAPKLAERTSFEDDLFDANVDPDHVYSLINTLPGPEHARIMAEVAKRIRAERGS